MKKTIAITLMIGVLLVMPTSPVLAHPADVYTHLIHLDLAEKGLSIKWEVKPGPILVSYIWFEADTDKNEAVSADEAETWATERASKLTATLNAFPLPLKFERVDFPSTRDDFQSGNEQIVFHLSADWPEPVGEPLNLSFRNNLEEQKSLNWYYITAQDDLEFQTPKQKNSNISFEIYPPNVQAPDGSRLLTTWDSSMPSLSSWQGRQTDPVTQTAEQVVPGLADRTPQEVLLDLVRRRDFSPGFYAFALGISLLLGALHALTPGHGKTVVAAYLVGSRGTAWHAVVLGSVVTLTHTGSVFLLGAITLAASQYILPTSIIPILEIVSGLLILGLGFYLLSQRFQHWRTSREHERARAQGLEHDHDHVHEHPNDHDHHHDHEHSHEVPEAITWRSLIALGVSGGLVPCPDAIAILLVAIAINRILLGLALIVSFSLGLAVVLIVIGLLMVNSRRLFDRMGAFDRIAPVMPIVSALVVLALGFGLTWGAYARARDSFSAVRTSSGVASEAKILYLREGQGQVKQLFEMNVKQKESVALTQPPNSTVDYALSPDQSRVVYVLQTEDLSNEIWLMDFATREKRKITNCENSICSQPVWSPDGRRVVYEHLSLAASNATGLATLWWFDAGPGEAKPVFPEDQLPGANPRWSPEGKWLSYATPESIRLYNLETGESHVIESILGASANWSPDSRSVLYRDVLIQDNQFITQLFIYDLASKTKNNVIPELGFENILAAWSPDGRWIAVVRRDLSISRGDQIWVMRPDGSNARAITDTPDVLHGSLNWSPDGRHLLYDVYRLDSIPLQSGLQIIDVESSMVTDLGINGYNPRWIWPE